MIYGLPNRGFLHQKLVVLGLFGTALIGLLLGLTVVVTSQTALSRDRARASPTSPPGGSAAASRSAR